MPQLMPLMWSSSVIMSLVILLTLIDMYLYKNVWDMNWESSFMMKSEMIYKW